MPPVYVGQRPRRRRFALGFGLTASRRPGYDLDSLAWEAMAALRRRAVLTCVAGLLGFAALGQPAFCQVGAEKAADNAAQSIDRGDLGEGRNILDQALKQYPRSAALHKVAAALEFKAGRFDAMRAELLRALACDANDSEIYLNLALLELGQRRTELRH